MHRNVRSFASLAATLVLVGAVVPAASAREDDGTYAQANLVSDLSGRALRVDPNLKNPWGLVHSATSPWWISDNGTGLATLYTGDGAPVSLQGPPTATDLHNEVIVPPPAESTPDTLAAPTGVVFNSTSDFVVTKNGVSAPAAFIFTTEDGTLSGWSPKVDRRDAILTVDNQNATSGPVYKGLAIGTDDGRNRLFATNFRFGTVDTFDGSFKQIKKTDAFVDREIPSGYAPFGIQNINGLLYVTYAKQDAAKHDDVKGPGFGFVDIYTTDGRLARRLVRHGALNAPWGLALAPEHFGEFSRALLVGNFGDGRIHAYDTNSGEFRGTLRDSHDTPIVIDGLWGLAFGNGAAAGPTTTLFFTAGINSENDGLFGTLTPARAD